MFELLSHFIVIKAVRNNLMYDRQESWKDTQIKSLLHFHDFIEEFCIKSFVIYLLTRY